MWNWLVLNKVWLFSGAGVTIAVLIWNFLFKPKATQPVQQATQQPNIYVDTTVSPIISPTISPVQANIQGTGKRIRLTEDHDNILPNVCCLRPEIAAITYDANADVWSKDIDGGFSGAVIPFSNEPRPPKRTAALDSLKARLTFYKHDIVEEFKRIDFGCWSGEAYRYVHLEVGGIVYLIAAIQMDRHGGTVSNPRYAVARYSEDGTVVEMLPDGKYEIKVDLSAGDHGEYAETYWFQLQVGDQLEIRRINQRPTAMT